VRLRLADATLFAVALCPEPEAVSIASDPAFAVQIESAAILHGLPFELIEQYEVMHGLVVYRVAFNIRKGGSAIFVREPRDEWWEILRRPVIGGVLVFCWFRRRLRLFDGLLLRVPRVWIGNGWGCRR
jgi:hypothetical protein